MPISFSVQKFNANPDNRLEGTITPINLAQAPYEAVLEISGYSYHLIFGRQINGWFICVPNWNIGAELAHPSDAFWNKSSLSNAGAGKRNAYYIAAALAELGTYL